MVLARHHGWRRFSKMSPVIEKQTSCLLEEVNEIPIWHKDGCGRTAGVPPIAPRVTLRTHVDSTCNYAEDVLSPQGCAWLVPGRGQKCRSYCPHKHPSPNDSRELEGKRHSQDRIPYRRLALKSVFQGSPT